MQYYGNSVVLPTSFTTLLPGAFILTLSALYNVNLQSLKGGGSRVIFSIFRYVLKKLILKSDFFTELKNTNFLQFCAPKRKGRSNGYIGKTYMIKEKA